MAGDWIKMEHVTPDKPEVVRVAESLGIDQDAVVGKLCRFWIWADQQSADGNSLGVTTSFLDRLTNCSGFTAALIECGWLIYRNGAISVPNFTRHNGQTAKARALTSDRVKRLRNAQTVTPALPEKRREEKRREEENPLPPLLKTEAFSKAWIEWQAFRKESKKTLTPSTVRKQLAQLEKWGHDGAIASIDQSIRNGWTGLFEPKDSKGQSRQSPRALTDEEMATGTYSPTSGYQRSEAKDE